VHLLRRDREQKVAMLDALVVLDEPLASRRPGVRLTDLAAKQEREPKPERTTSRTRTSPSLDVNPMQTFENALILEIASGQVRGCCESFKIVCVERSRLIGATKSVVSVTPRAAFVALTPTFKSIDHPMTYGRARLE
jgi:hypothetical protein